MFNIKEANELVKERKSNYNNWNQEEQDLYDEICEFIRISISGGDSIYNLGYTVGSTEEMFNSELELNGFIIGRFHVAEDIFEYYVSGWNVL